MTIKSSDIGLLNSGSSIFNTGLGGPISSIPLKNKLFEDVNVQDYLKGYNDYKCIYIKNLSSTDSFYNLSINVTDNNFADISFGFPNIFRCTTCPNIFNFNKEIHALNFEYTQGVEGNFDLIYDKTPIYINWDGDINYLKSQIETGFYFLEDDFSISIKDYVCVNSVCNLTIHIEFFRPKKYELLSISDIDIGVGSNLNFSSFRTSVGGPINTFASFIESSKISPRNIDGSNINFFNNKELILFEKLGPQEFIPMWIKRYVYNLRVNVFTDSLVLNISAED